MWALAWRGRGKFLNNRDSFSTYHPVVNFLFFALVLLGSMCLMHPVCLAISLASALSYGVYLNGKKAIRFALTVMLPMMVFVAIINPVFNHQGVTILLYLPSGNPLTLESILYGLASTAMLAAVMQWFSCYSAVMTSDKFVYLFGRIIPALSLILSMTLRFVPKFKSQIALVQEAQKSVGRDSSEGSLFHRIRLGIIVLSIMITWSLENAIETADSMKSRGYGLPGRTAFSIYTWQERDTITLTWLLFCGWFLGCGWLAGGLGFQYYPLVKTAPVTPLTLCFFLAYTALCLTPILLNKKEDFVWKRLLTQQ